jgi:hypothetical protein
MSSIWFKHISDLRLVLSFVGVRSAEISRGKCIYFAAADRLPFHNPGFGPFRPKFRP